LFGRRPADCQSVICESAAENKIQYFQTGNTIHPEIIMYANIKYGIVILAAGNSSRLGQPKQLLGYLNSTLLLNAVDQCLQLPDAVVTVVTGASQAIVEEQLAGRNVDIRYNPDWETGMASSIRSGVSELLRVSPFIDAVLIAVCDQPYLTTGVLASLVNGYLGSDKGIVASSYEGTLGTPVLFSSKYFSALLELEGQDGAKKIIRQHPADTTHIDFPLGKIDIDTAEDYSSLLDQSE
jgi:molybdenum cofactor cytidylyltransferase